MELFYMAWGLITALEKPAKAASLLKEILQYIGIAESAMPAVCATAKVIQTVKPVTDVITKMH